VEDQLIVEIKALKTIAEEHAAQLLGYLKAGCMEHGLLINFGSYWFQIRKFIFSAGPPQNGPLILVVLAFLCGPSCALSWPTKSGPRGDAGRCGGFR
jgi:hypothetical protein